MSVLESPARRKLLRGSIASYDAASTVAPARLPWVISEQTFIEECIHCNRSVEQCETKVIQRDKAGFPFVDFSTDECTFCGQCEAVCEQSLFKPTLDRANKKPWSHQISIETACFTNKGVFCQSCQDVCDSRAITFSYSQAGVPNHHLIQTYARSVAHALAPALLQHLRLNRIQRA
ncbi:MAG: hypothetical protein MK214_08745 [Thalassotalea sp.]|nr:hypothetical protein [Thalassotalea sp.]